VIGAGLGLIGASIQVHDNIDIFMIDMSRKTSWLTWAAVAGCLAAGLSAVERLHEFGPALPRHPRHAQSLNMLMPWRLHREPARVAMMP
jgi:hypothetical protein